MLQSVSINEGESKRKLPKMFAGKNLQMTQKNFTGWLNKKRSWCSLLEINACVATNLKTILSWPKISAKYTIPS